MRSLWKGSISFGLVNVPVRVYSATENHDVSLHQVHAEDGGRIRYQRRCEVCGEVVAYEDDASGKMAIKDRKMRFTEMTLDPRVRIAAGDLEKAKALHEDAHAACFIASSVNFPVRHAPTVTRA